MDKEGVYAQGRSVCIAHAWKRGLLFGPAAMLGLTNTLNGNKKWCNGFCIQCRQSFTKETFSYDEHLKR